MAAVRCGKTNEITGTTTPTTTNNTPTTTPGASPSGYYVTGIASVPSSCITTLSTKTKSIIAPDSISTYPISGGTIILRDYLSGSDRTLAWTGQKTHMTKSDGSFSISIVESMRGKPFLIEITIGNMKLISTGFCPGDSIVASTLKKMGV